MRFMLVRLWTLNSVRLSAPLSCDLVFDARRLRLSHHLVLRETLHLHKQSASGQRQSTRSTKQQILREMSTSACVTSLVIRIVSASRALSFSASRFTCTSQFKF
jgi:predicted GTPase